jgi:hypothetical protein
VTVTSRLRPTAADRGAQACLRFSLRDSCAALLGPLLQFGAFRFGLLEDGDVGVGIFPKREEVFSVLMFQPTLDNLAGCGIQHGYLLEA